MTQAQPSGAVPQFSIHDRCRKAREYAGLDQTELAERIGIARNTVGNYETGAVTKLKGLVLRQWALACGVSFDWLAGNPQAPGGEIADVGKRLTRWLPVPAGQTEDAAAAA